MPKPEKPGAEAAPKTTPQAASTPQPNTQAQTKPAANPAPAGESDAIAMLKADHRKVEGLFARYESDGADKAQIIRQVCTELRVHTVLEEEIFYPACRQAADEEEPLDEAQVEHDSAKMLIADLMRNTDEEKFRDAKLKVLAEQIKHHVAEEEKPGEGIFAKAQEAGINTPDLARRLDERKRALMSNPDALPPVRPVSFQTSTPMTGQNRENDMANYRGNDRERDERGRFMDDDDRGRGRDRDDDRGYRSRGGRDDDDGRGWYGDPQGHSEASRRGWAERRGGGDEQRSFRNDDDDRGGRGGGRGQGGWFGDSQGHSEASRRGWEDRDDRGGGRGRGRDDDDDRGYRSRGGEGGGRGQGGWFGDSQGHSEAARRGWDDRDNGGRGRGRDDDDDRGGRGRGQGGWFGDSRGHAEAARQGWENRDDRGGGGGRGRDDDDRGYRSRGGGGGGRGEGGWFGDPEGHSEAARRGWQGRR